MAGRGRPGPDGRIERLRRALSDDGRNVVDMVLADREQTDRWVADVLTEMAEAADINLGGPIRRMTVTEWRAGQPRGVGSA